jgi:hypothetical protein
MPAVRDDIARFDLLLSQVTDAAASFDAQCLDRDAAVTAMNQWSTIVHAGEAALAMAAARVAECGPRHRPVRRARPTSWSSRQG